jgi:GNAT superfamily N-acetyltransferase
MRQSNCRFVLADGEHLHEIRAMQERSFRALGRGFYSPSAIESFLCSPGTLDEAVIGENHYFVTLDADDAIVATGGWSQRKPGYAQGLTAAPLEADCAIVRSVFVAPERARQGLATALMAHVEEDALNAGIRKLKLTATLSGAPLYEALGYRTGRQFHITLGCGQRFGAVDMEKHLLPQASGDERLAA